MSQHMYTSGPDNVLCSQCGHVMDELEFETHVDICPGPAKSNIAPPIRKQPEPVERYKIPWAIIVPWVMFLILLSITACLV